MNKQKKHDIYIQWDTTQPQKNELLIETTQMNFIYVLSERSQAQQFVYCMIVFILNYQKRKICRNKAD